MAPTAVLSGEVRIGRGSCIMHGAVVAAEGGPVEIGANCVIMENAVLRGTPQNAPSSWVIASWPARTRT